jgi:hypothetical protein
VKACAKTRTAPRLRGLTPAAMSSTPQPAPLNPRLPRSTAHRATSANQTPFDGSTPRPAGLSPPEIRDARCIQVHSTSKCNTFHSLKTSNGVFHLRRFLGRLFSASSIAWIADADIVLKSVFFGRYQRMRPLVFSFVPRSHGWYGCAKNTFTPPYRSTDRGRNLAGSDAMACSDVAPAARSSPISGAMSGRPRVGARSV